MDITKAVKAGTEGIWVKWKDGAEILMRMSPKLLTELYKKCSVRQENGQDELDQELYTAAITESVILDWRGITVNGGEAFPCTPENRKLLMDNVMEFSTFLSTTCLKLEQAEEAEAKNS